MPDTAVTAPETARDADAARDARRLRLLLGGAVVATLVAPGVSTWLALRHDTSTSTSSGSAAAVATQSVFPLESDQLPGYQLVAYAVRGPGSQSLQATLHATTGIGSWILVLQCDTGNVTVTWGAATTSVPCPGSVETLATLPTQPGGRLRVSATVDARQKAAWGVAAYRQASGQ